MHDERNRGRRHGEREKVERNIWKRTDRDGRTVFEVVYRDSDGGQHRQRVQGGIMAARALRADIDAKKGKGERVAPRPRLTFDAAGEEWFTAQASQLRPATRESYRHALDAHLLPAWRHRKLDSITVGEVAQLVARMQTPEYRRAAEATSSQPIRVPASTGYSAWTIRGVLTAAGRCFEYARRRMDWPGENPVRGLDRRERPASDQRERRVLSRDELTRLLACSEPRYRLVFAFAAGTGARLGEVLGLRWRDVDLDAGTVSIEHQLDRRGQRRPLKTARSRRVVDLPASLASELRAHRLASSRSGPGDYVLVSRSDSPHDHRNVAGRALRRAVLAADLDESEGRVTFHSFRHGYASAWIAAGGDIVELSRVLGHANPSITASTYSHEFERSSRSAERRDRIDSIFGNTLATPADSKAQQTASGVEAKVVDLQRKAADGNGRQR